MGQPASKCELNSNEVWVRNVRLFIGQILSLLYTKIRCLLAMKFHAHSPAKHIAEKILQGMEMVFGIWSQYKKKKNRALRKPENISMRGNPRQGLEPSREWHEKQVHEELTAASNVWSSSSILLPPTPKCWQTSSQVERHCAITFRKNDHFCVALLF